MEQYLLGIDVGTTGTKTVLYSTERGLVASDYMGYSLTVAGVGRCEQDAMDWWRAVVKTVRTVCGEAGAGKNVVAISLSTQGGTLVPVDNGFEPLCPAIVWNDARARQKVQEFQRRYGPDRLYRTTGWRGGNGLNAMQIRWLADHQPEIFHGTRYFLSVPDYISAKLTGIPVVDISNAGINQLADIRTQTYDQEIMAFTGATEEQLAPIVPSGTEIGHLTPEAAEELGISPDAVLISGAHDQYACMAGAGCFVPGDLLLGTGTAWVVTTLSEEADFESGFSQSRAATGGLWGTMGVLSSGGVCLEWLRGNVIGQDSALTYAQIDDMAKQKPAGSNGLFFHPYFNGRSFPERETHSKASLIGLDLSHDRFDIARAVMEGVTFQAAWILEAFRTQRPISSLKLSGGAAKSGLWCQIIADTIGLPVIVPNVADLAGVGAVLLAGLGAGVFSSPQSGYARLGVQQRTVMPEAELSKRYTDIFAEFKRQAECLSSMYETSNKPITWRD